MLYEKCVGSGRMMERIFLLYMFKGFVDFDIRSRKICFLHSFQKSTKTRSCSVDMTDTVRGITWLPCMIYFQEFPHSGDKGSAPLVFIVSGRFGLVIVNNIFTVNSEKSISYEVKFKSQNFLSASDLNMAEWVESFLSAQDVWLGYFHSNDNPMIGSASCLSKFDLFSVCL